MTAEPNTAELAQLPIPVTLIQNVWTMGDPTVADYVASNNQGKKTDTDTTKQSIIFYWVKPDTNVSVKYHYCISLSGQGQDCSPDAQAAYGKVAGPAGVDVTAYGQAVGIAPNQSEIGWSVRFKATKTSPSQPPGVFKWIQIVESDNVKAVFDDGAILNCNRGPGLDTAMPYPHGNNTNAEDGPGVSLPPHTVEISSLTRFKMYLMWDSLSGSNILVPLGFVEWNVSGDANYDVTTSTWTLNPNASTSTSVFNSSTTFPEWGPGLPLTAEFVGEVCQSSE